jgi:hypothetical protein
MTATTVTTPGRDVGKLSLLRCALTGAQVLIILFLLCWLGGLFNIPGASHLYLSLFTSVPMVTVGALAYGLISSGIVGLLTGALVAFFYNVFAMVERR